MTVKELRTKLYELPSEYDDYEITIYNDDTFINGMYKTYNFCIYNDEKIIEIEVNHSKLVWSEDYL